MAKPPDDIDAPNSCTTIGWSTEPRKRSLPIWMACSIRESSDNWRKNSFILVYRRPLWWDGMIFSCRLRPHIRRTSGWSPHYHDSVSRRYPFNCVVPRWVSYWSLKRMPRMRDGWRRGIPGPRWSRKQGIWCGWPRRLFQTPRRGRGVYETCPRHCGCCVDRSCMIFRVRMTKDVFETRWRLNLRMMMGTIKMIDSMRGRWSNRRNGPWPRLHLQVLPSIVSQSTKNDGWRSINHWSSLVTV